MGYQNVDDYITPPDRQPQPQPDPMKEATLEAIKVDTAVKQGELEVKRMKAETDANEAKMDAKFKMAELAMENEQERSVKLG
jgi:hypothetical protein